MKMSLSTKITLGVLFISAIYMGGYKKDYEGAYLSMLVGIIAGSVWYNERRKDR